MTDHITAGILVEAHNLPMPDFDDLKNRIEEAAAAHKATMTVDGRRYPEPEPAAASSTPADRAAVLREAERHAIRYVLLAEAADFLRDRHFRDGMTVQEIGTAMRHWADRERRMADKAKQAGEGR
ncbi:hypothetical protein [Streptomyces sp. NPDC058066]|uniref:hypothetical protein n=1 Tax=Streptomyces sp. NPDC058066 TaxID=3346323 RepID=UPI0036EAC4E1